METFAPSAYCGGTLRARFLCAIRLLRGYPPCAVPVDHPLTSGVPFVRGSCGPSAYFGHTLRARFLCVKFIEPLASK